MLLSIFSVIIPTEHRGSAPVCSVPQPQQTAPGQPPQGVFDQGARFDPNKPVNVPVSVYHCFFYSAHSNIRDYTYMLADNL